MKYLSTQWVDYVEEPMKYQAFMHHFSLWLVEGFMGWVGGVVVVGGGWGNCSWGAVVVCFGEMWCVWRGGWVFVK